MADRRILVNLSGGLDSAHTAWKLLAEGHPLVLHHCELTSPEGRTAAELDAVARILGWLQDQGLDRFEVVRTAFDYGTLQTVIYDVELVGFLTGVVLRDRRFRSLSTVAVSATIDDATVRSVREPRGVIRRQVAETVARRELDWLWPIAHYDRAELVAATPRDLLELVWWCRRPDDGRACHRCLTCRQMDALDQGDGVASTEAPTARSAR